MSFLSTQDHRTSLELDGKSGFYHPSSIFCHSEFVIFSAQKIWEFFSEKKCFPSIKLIKKIFIFGEIFAIF
jgi:hypothetical protein